MASYSFNIDDKIAPKPDGTKLKASLITLLQKSTATLFKRHARQYKCFYCNHIFLLPSKLKEHTTETHKNTNFVDNLQIWREYKLTSNLMVDVQNLSCTVCDTKLFDLKELQIHLSEKHDEVVPKIVLGNFVCCKLSDDNIIKCYLCKREFDYFGDLIHHMKTKFHAGQMPRRMQCTLCNMTFKSKYGINTHLQLVHRMKFRCDYCLEDFKSKPSLSLHIRRIHNKERNGTCDICGKAFFDKHHLKVHVLSHSEEKLFECDICQKKFTRHEVMKQHKRIHYNDRRYACKICGRAFVQGQALSSHMAVHSDERKFKCPVCDKAFKVKNTMRKHLKNVHRKKNINND